MVLRGGAWLESGLGGASENRYDALDFREGDDALDSENFWARLEPKSGGTKVEGTLCG